MCYGASSHRSNSKAVGGDGMTIGVFMPEGTEADVCIDIGRRQQLGKSKYGTTVAENPLSLRQWLQHAYEEALDQAIYLKRAIAEIDAQEASRHG